ncbi:MAG: SDR family oxidoreductase [Planctomycetota bacterium]
MSLEGQVAVITGASSGIGHATATLLRQAGMKLVINGRRADRLHALADELGDTHAVPGDITDPQLPKRLLDTAVDAFGQCDVVFNNAGVLHVFPFEDLDLDKLCDMVRINVEAAYRLMYETVAYFKTVGPPDRGGRGQLINTSSVLGTKVRPTAGWYAGTKYAIEAVCESLRMELAGTDIKISAVEPGLVLTDLHREWDQPSNVKLGMEKPLRPEDIARCVKFILDQPDHVRIPKLMALPGEHAI